MLSEDPRGRQFQSMDYSRPSAALQQAALTSKATDAPQASAQPAGGDDTGGHWTGKLPGGVDASWVRNAIKLIGREKVGSFEDLADPEHRKWIRRKMRKANQQKKATVKPEPEVAEGEGEETMPEVPPEQAETPQSRITVFPSGRLPKGRLVDRPTGGLPGPGGWVPAGEGLWWPPYPTTSGPIAHPELTRPSGGGTGVDYVLNAAGQTAALEGRGR